MDGRFEVYLRPPAGFRGVAHQRRPDTRHRRLAVRRVRGQQDGHRGQLPARISSSCRRSPSGSAAPSARRASSARPCRTSSASPTVRAGRWSETPATTRTSSPPRASPTPSGTPSCAPPPGPGVLRRPDPSTRRWRDYQATRDEQVLPIYEFTTQLATLEPPPPDLQQLLGAVHGNQDAMDGFAQVNAGVMSPAEYFSDENVARILATREPTGELREGRARRSS